MRQFLRRILCKLFGHPLVQHSRHWQCKRCGQAWERHRGVVVPTDRITPDVPPREEPGWVQGLEFLKADAKKAADAQSTEPTTFHFHVDEKGATFTGKRDSSGKFVKGHGAIAERGSNGRFVKREDGE